MMWQDGVQLGREAMRRLRVAAVCDVDTGLTQAEFIRIEEAFGFHFADDHRAFLAEGLPTKYRAADAATRRHLYTSAALARLAPR